MTRARDIYLATIKIDPGKTVASLTLPTATGHAPESNLHVFAVAIS